MASSGFSNRQPYDFTEIYATSGGAGKPIHTRQRLNEAREQHSTLLHPGTAHITDLFGTKIFFTLGRKGKKRNLLCVRDGKKSLLELDEKDKVYIDTHSIMDLARQDDIAVPEEDEDIPHFRPLEYQKMMQMQRRCPLYLDIDWHIEDDTLNTDRKLDLIRQLTRIWNKEWEESSVRHDLLEAVQANAPRMNQVDNVVCFGLGAILPSLEHGRYCIQHLAAADIARTLAQAQGRTIEVFAQDPQYTDTCKASLKELSPAITVVDSAEAEGLSLVDENTFIVSLNATAIILEPAIQLAGPTGPAGMLIHPWLENVEETWNGMHTGPVRAPYLWGTAVEYTYRDKCERVRLVDEEWLGVGGGSTQDGETLSPVYAELLFAKK